jgi:hypothetical protein
MFEYKVKRGKKGKAIPVTGCGSPQGCEWSRLPHFLDNQLTDGSVVVRLMLAALYPPGRFLLPISVRDRVDPRAIVQLERLGQLKKSNDLIGTRTRNLLACSKYIKYSGKYVDIIEG